MPKGGSQAAYMVFQAICYTAINFCLHISPSFMPTSMSPSLLIAMCYTSILENALCFGGGGGGGGGERDVSYEETK